ncbi:MAG: hypothetical protein LBP87_05180, partial [Planctomycetaceae bacterium]|nr:hypothetical protein [Planctomycetaceae bacterium]
NTFDFERMIFFAFLFTANLLIVEYLSTIEDNLFKVLLKTQIYFLKSQRTQRRKVSTDERR